MIELPRRFKSKIDAQINIVPYIDVMLVLLVIFMLATPIIVRGIEVNLPNADSNDFRLNEEQKQHKLTITVNKEGNYSIDSLEDINPEEIVSLTTVKVRIQAYAEAYSDIKVFIRGDEEVKYNKIVELLSILQKYIDIENIGLITDPFVDNDTTINI